PHRASAARWHRGLRGLERCRIVTEDASRSYRRAHVEHRRERPIGPDDRRAVRNSRSKLEAMLAADSTLSAARIPTTMADEDMVNALAQYLALEPLEKQALLEQPSLRTRAASLVELLEMKSLMARVSAGRHLTH